MLLDYKDDSNLCWVGLFIWFILWQQHVQTNIYAKEAHTDTAPLYCIKYWEPNTHNTIAEFTWTSATIQNLR